MSKIWLCIFIGTQVTFSTMRVQVYCTMIWYLQKLWNGLPRCLSGEDSACQCWRHVRLQFDPRIGKSPWRRKWQATPVLLSGESHRQRSPVGYSPQHHKESETTQHTRTQIRILKRSHSPLAIYSHAKLLQCYWPYIFLTLYVTHCKLFTYDWRFMPLNPHHLILPSSQPPPFWQWPICYLYLWICFHCALFCF